MRKKVTIAGSGNVGASCALRLAQSGLADIVMVDIKEGVAQGKALDIFEAGVDVRLVGSNEYEATANSDVVVIAAGLPRKTGMSLDDLLWLNHEVVENTAEEAAKHSPGAILIVVTNPVEPMCHVALKVSGFPKQRVIGMSGALDTARFRAFVAEALGVSVRDVTALVLGGHADALVPLVRFANVSGIPVAELADAATLERVVKRTREAGTEIVKLYKTGSAYYAPAAAIHEMVEAILEDSKRVLACSTYLEGEYGIQGCFVGVPVKLGAAGVEKVFCPKLHDEELAALKRSAAGVKRQVELLQLRHAGAGA